jgi:Mn2+/Fe2+ NRAMP family transporter
MKNWQKVLGPGVLFASTAIGVSHLVQATQAGANFGFSLIWAVILANILKFPFFEYASRYANVKNQSILQAYWDKDKMWLYAYLAITFVSMFLVTGAVGIVTYGFMEHLFGLNDYTGVPHFTLFLMFIAATSILWIGKFSTLNKLIKFLGLVLLLTTVFAFVIAVFRGKQGQLNLLPELSTDAIAFILPLMGWMPTAVDLSVWNSIWTVERIKDSAYKPSLKETLLEFNFGYWFSATLAVMFVTMGALMVYGTDTYVPQKPVEFSAFVKQIYTETVGNWSYLLISSASFSIMLSTFITVLDGYSRAISNAMSLVSVRVLSPNKMYRNVLILVASGSLILILTFLDDPKGMGQIVNIATTISFLIAPFVAYLNFKIVTSENMPEYARPKKFMRILSWLGLIYLVGFSVFFVVRGLSG